MFPGYYSSEPDLMECMKELHAGAIKRNVYMLLCNGDMRAATVKADIVKHLESPESIADPSVHKIDEVTLIYGLVLDPASLPYEIAPDIMKGKSLFMIVEPSNEVEFDEYDGIEEVTCAIAHFMEKDDTLEITDFVVVLGYEIPMVFAPSKSGDAIAVFPVLGEYSS